MLSDAEKRDIEAELEHYDYKRGACVDAMQIIQRHRGWVSDESLHDLAPLLDMTPTELDSVATFYNLIFRRPVGANVILICDSVSCWLMGYEHLRQHLTDRLGIAYGETTPDGQFTLLPIPCLGTCDRAPALMINDELYCDLDPQRLDHILARYQGKKGGDGTTSHPAYPA